MNRNYGDDIRGCDDWEEVVKGVNSLSKSGLVGGERLLCPQKSRFSFHSPFPGLTFEVFGLATFYSLSIFLETKGPNGNKFR